MNSFFSRLFLCLTAALLALAFSGPASAQFDASYARWDSLVKKHVRWLPDNKQSRVDYAGFKADRAELKKVAKKSSNMLPQMMRVPRTKRQPSRMADRPSPVSRAAGPAR